MHFQLHHQNQHSQQNHQQYQPPHEPPPQRSWKSPSPQPPPVQDTRTWNPQGFVLHDRTNQQHFPVHYTTPDRYQNGNETPRDNHLSYTVINPSPSHYSQSPPLASSPRRSKTPQRQGSLPEVVRRPEPVSLQQLQSPVTAPPVDDMEPQNISFIGNAEDDALRQGINRLNISSGTRTYRIPSPTRPSLSRNSFHQHQESESGESSETNEKGFYISFDKRATQKTETAFKSETRFAEKGSHAVRKSESRAKELRGFESVERTVAATAGRTVHGSQERADGEHEI